MSEKGTTTDKEFPLIAVLHNLFAFLKNQVIGEYCVWGNGATFDITLLENAYRQHNLSPYWNFRSIRDVRTIKMLELVDPNQFKPTVAHDALADANAQARFICASLTELKRIRAR